MRPKNPDCEACPVKEHCAARALRVATASDAEPFDVASLPEKAKKANRREESVAAFAVEATRHADGASAFLLVRRPEGGLLGGLWEFPSVVMPRVDADADEKAAAARAFVGRASRARIATRAPRRGRRAPVRGGGDARLLARQTEHRRVARARGGGGAGGGGGDARGVRGGERRGGGGGMALGVGG